MGHGVDWWPQALIGGCGRVGRDAAAGCVSRERQNAVAVHAYNTHLISSRDIPTDLFKEPAILDHANSFFRETPPLTAVLSYAATTNSY